MDKKIVLSWLAIGIMVVWSVVSLTVAYTQREERRAELAEQQLISQQAMEQETARQAAEKERLAAEAAEQAANMPPLTVRPTPAPTPKPSPKPQENSTVAIPEDGVDERQPEYIKPTPPPTPPPAPTPTPEQPTTPTQPTPVPTPKPQPSKPKDGDRNDKGQIYIDGFGWLDPPAGVDMGTVDNDGWEDSPQIGF